MIFVKIEPDGPGRSKCLCGIEGNLDTITTNTIEAVHAIYKAMAEDAGPLESLAVFKLKVMRAISDPLSPVWDLSGDVRVVENEEGRP